MRVNKNKQKTKTNEHLILLVWSVIRSDITLRTIACNYVEDESGSRENWRILRPSGKRKLSLGPEKWGRIGDRRWTRKCFRR